MFAFFYHVYRIAHTIVHHRNIELFPLRLDVARVLTRGTWLNCSQPRRFQSLESTHRQTSHKCRSPRPDSHPFPTYSFPFASTKYTIIGSCSDVLRDYLPKTYAIESISKVKHSSASAVVLLISHLSALQ